MFRSSSKSSKWNLAYAFVQAPQGYTCGKCLEFIFTGEGKFLTHLSHEKIAGKRLIVMAIRLGGPLADDQFNLLIPGGGVGHFNGCSKVLGTKIGKRYGGLLTECMNDNMFGEVLDKETRYIKTKSCLINKCKEFFTGNKQALEGCLFLANWMEAASDPEVVFEEVDCPKELLSNY